MKKSLLYQAEESIMVISTQRLFICSARFARKKIGKAKP
jgi:hypothetical protein